MVLSRVTMLEEFSAKNDQKWWDNVRQGLKNTFGLSFNCFLINDILWFNEFILLFFKISMNKKGCMSHYFGFLDKVWMINDKIKLHAYVKIKHPQHQSGLKTH